MWRLRTHVTGVKVHSQNDAYCAVDYGQWPHDSNLTIAVLATVFDQYTPLPKKLYLQMDNCGRENKNRFVISFLCYLVELKVFDEVKMGFLMVGK